MLTQGQIALFQIAMHNKTNSMISQGYIILNTLCNGIPTIELPMVSLWENKYFSKKNFQ